MKDKLSAYVKASLKRECNYVAEIEHLRMWIKHIGMSADICTRNALGEICENCRCKHQPKDQSRPAMSSDDAR